MAAQLPGQLNIEYVFQDWRNAGWAATLPNPLAQDPTVRQNTAGIAGAANVDAPFTPFLAYGWPAELPRLPHRLLERAAASLPAAVNIETRFENWVNLGWRPALPELPAFRRYFSMPELTWRSDPIFDFFIVPLEWGFQPTTPEGLRTWFARSGAVMPGANIDAPLFGFLPAGWASQYTDILAKPPRRFPVEAQTLAPAPSIQWVNTGWEATLPLLTGDPATRLMGAHFPAAVNIDPRLEAFLAHGWQVLPPHLRHPRPEAGGAFMRGVDIDARLDNWINTGWVPILPTPLIHDPLSQQAAAALPISTNIDAPFFGWINDGWGATLRS